MVLGRVEHVYYSDIEGLSDVPFIGKIDTGADTTSMHADNIRVWSDDPKLKDLPKRQLLKALNKQLNDSSQVVTATVSFSVPHPYSGKQIQVQRPLADVGVIRSRTSKTPLYRPVINLPLTIAGKTVYTKVNLTDRDHFSAPILIGKSFLENNAWVLAGYDYLQQQPRSQIVREKEQVELAGLPIEARFSGRNKYSNLHAEQIDIDKKAQRVMFDVVGIDGIKKGMSLPLVRMRKINGEARPLVYLPVTFGEDEYYLLVYLKDREKTSSMLSVGQEMLNQYFTIKADGVLINTRTDPLFEDYPLFRVGHIENATVEGMTFPVKLDTGADVSSMHAQNIKRYKKNGQSMVSFTYQNEQGQKQNFIRKMVDEMRIKAKKGEKQTVRPVVEMQVQLGSVNKTIRVNLQDRSRFHYSMILGKNMLKYGALVGSEQDYLLTH